MKLTARQCELAATTGDPIKLFDGGGLFLYVARTGLKSWRFKYRFYGKEKKLVLGRYPRMSLKAARIAHGKAQAMVEDGLDPSAERQRSKRRDRERIENSFSVIAQEWLAAKRPDITDRYHKTVKARLQEAKQMFGDEPVDMITPMRMLALVRQIQARGARYLATRVIKVCSNVFSYAIATGRCETNPAEAIRPAISGGVKTRRPARLTVQGSIDALQQIESVSQTWWATRFASRLTALTAQRPGVVRLAEKAEFQDLEGKAPIWRIPAAKMKLVLEKKSDSAFDFQVPLSRQSAAIVCLAIKASPESKLLFPGQAGWRKPINENALSDLYREAGLSGQHVPHGWRSSFSTIMNEWALEQGEKGDRAIIDLMLAHFPDTVEGIYNRAVYMPRRRFLAQHWADLLLQGAKPPEALLTG